MYRIPEARFQSSGRPVFPRALATLKVQLWSNPGFRVRTTDLVTREIRQRENTSLADGEKG